MHERRIPAREVLGSDLSVAAQHIEHTRFGRSACEGRQQFVASLYTLIVTLAMVVRLIQMRTLLHGRSQLNRPRHALI